MSEHQSTYCRWTYSSLTWIVAIILLLIVCWMLLTGKGSNTSCCTPTVVAPITTENAPSTNQKVSEPFSFSASANDFSSSGDSADVAWFSKSDSLKSILSGDVKIEGDKNAIKLTGSVDQQAAKDKVMADAQAFFGETVTIDNKIMVNAPPAPVAEQVPELAKIYFEISKADLPENTQTVLDPIITWSKSHPESKIVLSGFHDISGRLSTNQALAKRRAQAIEKALIDAGITKDKIEMRKPQSTEGSGSMEEARRVEIAIE